MGINNLFDKKYNGSVVPNALGERYFEPAPGRNWYAGLRINY
jgi:iron complex outermembrane receptor protein